MGLTALAVRSLLSRPLRSVLTLVGIALGVAVLVVSLGTGAGIDAAVDRTVEAGTGRADLRVSALQETGLHADTIDTIRGTDGVRAAAPAIERRTYLGPEVGPGDALPEPVTVLGIDVASEVAVRDLPLVAGEALTAGQTTHVLVSESLARQDGLSVGSRMTVQGAGERLRLTVVGILAGEGPIPGPDGRTVVMPLDASMLVFDTDGVTRIDVALADRATTTAVTTAFEGRLLSEPYRVTTPADTAAALRASTADFQGLTALIAAIALFAAALLILNTLSMTVVERRREVGLLRAAGATRSQITRVVLLQAAVLGSLGSILGIALGLVMASLVTPSIGDLGAVALDGTLLDPRSVVLALVIGVGVTVVAALEPARRAGRISPVEALSPRWDGSGERRTGIGWLVVVAALVATVGLVAWPSVGGAPGLVRAVVVYGLLLAGILSLPFILPAIVRIGGLPFRPVVMLEERLARNGLVRDPARAVLTVGALTVALAMLVALGGMSDQVRRAAAAWLDDVVPGDLVLTSIRPVGLDEGADALLADLDGVERISPIGTFEMAANGTRIDAAAVVGSDLADDGRLRFVAGDRVTALPALDAGGVLILPERLADRLGASVGDTVTAPDGAGGALELEVVGIVERTVPGPAGETALVGWGDATDHLGVLGADVFAVRFAPDATGEQRDALAAEARSFALEAVPLDRIDGAIGDVLGRVFGLFDALAIIAVVVAALGIVNTLSMNVLERVREIGILRAAGMTRSQVWRMVVVEAGIFGVAGAALGSIIGIVAGTAMVVLAGGRLDLASVIPAGAIALAFVLGIALAMLAAAYPARIAAGLPIVRAVRYQ
jgi:putative ABC transport system permease protein